MMNEIISKAKKKGLSEETYIKSLECMSKALEELKGLDAKSYWRHMRKLHGIVFDRHYDEEWATRDVEQLEYVNAEGQEKDGPHWTKHDVLSLTETLAFPNTVNEWDKYVAFNAAYSDFCSDKGFTENDIIMIGYLFYFKDEDWPTNTKVWDYFYSKCKL